MNAAVVRIGNTVHRTASPQSATIQRLLAHVRRRGVSWVPQPLGFDESGREMLSFVCGEVAHGEPDFRHQPQVLTDVASALRQWHDATADFAPRPDDVWMAHEPLPGADVIAHNDFAPYNHVFRDGRFVGAIDFDVCYPATRQWDLAWTIYRYVYLPAFATQTSASAQGWGDLTPSAAEGIAVACADPAAIFARGYGGVSPQDCIAAGPARIYSMAAWCKRQRSPAHRAWGQMYAAHARWLKSVAASIPARG